jgi:spoIIIJ-associated protein
MDYIESKGKTVDEAVFSGLIKMDLSIDEVDIEILDEGSGLFKNAKVRLTKKADASVPGVIETAEEKADKADRIDEIQERPRVDKPRADRSRSDRPPRRAAAPSEPVVVKAPENDAEAFLLGLFERMGVQVALESKQEDGVLKIDMSGRTMGMLIGRRGETLDALQYLTSLVINNGKEDYTKVMLDTEDYRKKREDTLKRLAARLADKVQKSGKRVVLEPMNPYERRILHATLQDYAKVYTYSEGEDPFRSVVVALKSKDGAQ